jgi:transcriptional regulator with XRE-family HTH domain
VRPTKRSRGDVGLRIKTWREHKGLTQPQLATRLRLDTSTVGHWERGKSRPRRLDRVAAAMTMTLAEFFGPLP